MWNLFFRNRRLLLLAISLIVVAGLSSYCVLPRMEDPLLTPRFGTINARLPGADAERVEALITEPLEEELRKIEEIKELRSTSRAGICTISVELRDDIDATDAIWSQVRDKLADAQRQLPAGAEAPEFTEQDVKAFALIVGLTWRQDDPPNFAILRRLAEQLKDELKAVPGTDDVELFGDPSEEYRVTVRPADLAARGLTFADVSRQLGASDAKVSSGQLRGSQSDLLLKMDTELDSLQRIGETLIKTSSEGQVTRLSDLAELQKGIAEPPDQLALVGGRPAVVLGALARDNKRIDHWSTTVSERLAAYRETLPPGIGLEIVFNQNRYVEGRLRSLLANLLLGSVAVVLVVGLMMGWKNALVVGAALPLSALMVLTGLQFLEIPIHQMSVTGLILALGLLIDNAIVIVDEVSHRIRTGSPPASAVAASTRHLAVPLFGSTLTTALAFAPIALMQGPAGEFVGSIAVSVILAISSSLLLAMTIVPAVAALFDGVGQGAPGRATPWRDGFRCARLTRVYRQTLSWIFAHPRWGMALGMALPVLGFIQGRHLPEQFFPPADRDQFQIELELPAHAALHETQRTVAAVRNFLMDHEEIQDVHWFLGESAPMFYYNLVGRRKNMSNFAQAIVQLRSAARGEALIHELQRDLDRHFSQARILVRQLEQGPPFDAPLEVRLFGPDTERLRELGGQLRGILAQTPDVIHTRVELSETLPNLAVRVDEHAARLAGLDHAVLARQLNSSLEGAVGGLVLEGTEGLPVRIRLGNPQRANLSQITSLELVSAGAASTADSIGVPFTAVAQVGLSAEVAAIQHLDGARMNEIQGFIPAGVLPAVVLRRFQANLADSSFVLPTGYSLAYGGEAAKRDQAIGSLLARVGVLLVMMVATLVLSFGSFRVAAVIAAVAVLSVGLGLGSLWLFGYPFGFMAIVGTMGLVGVAINDSIVVMASLRENPSVRDGEVEATCEVVVHATRHVLTTSLTTVAGFLPLVIAGGGFWPPMAISIAGGVGGATILALYFVPSTYLWMLRLSHPAAADELAPQVAVAGPPVLVGEFS